MAAMKPRTGDGPMEAVKEGRLIIVRVPLEGGGRLVVSVNDAGGQGALRRSGWRRQRRVVALSSANGRSSDRPFSPLRVGRVSRDGR